MNEDLHDMTDEVVGPDSAHDFDEPANPDMDPLTAQAAPAAISTKAPWIKRNLSYILLGVVATGGAGFMALRHPAHHVDEFQSAQMMANPPAGQIPMAADPVTPARNPAPAVPIPVPQPDTKEQVGDSLRLSMNLGQTGPSVTARPVAVSAPTTVPSASVAAPVSIVTAPVDRAPVKQEMAQVDVQETKHNTANDAMVRENHQLKLRIAALRVQLNSMIETQKSAHYVSHKAAKNSMNYPTGMPDQIKPVNHSQNQLIGWVLTGVSGETAAIRGPDGKTHVVSVGQGVNGFVITAISGSLVETTIGRIQP